MQKQIAFIVIGDEILSGRTRDINVSVLAGRLAQIGANLAEVRMIPDERARIVNCIRELTSQFDYVFTSGGIGPTYDDITADCVAEAFSRNIDVREDARKILGTTYANGETDLNAARLRMARIPDGATLIANPISKAPGFRTENLFTLAGVPKIFEAMLDDALPQIERGDQILAKSQIVKLPESAIAGPLAKIAKAFPKLSVGSYPDQDDNGYFAEIVVKGFDESMIDAAMIKIKAIAD